MSDTKLAEQALVLARSAFAAGWVATELDADMNSAFSEWWSQYAENIQTALTEAARAPERTDG